jgi:hypothetical protein
MSRLNIEDSLFADARFMDFCVMLKSEVKAIGWWVKVARLAQSYWKNNKELIPEAAYKFHRFPKELIDCKIVEKRLSGYYLCGSEENFAWIFSQVENGKRGGRPRQVANITQEQHNPNSTLAKPTANPPTPTPTPTLLATATIDGVNDVKQSVKMFMTWWNKAAEEIDIIKVYESPDNIALIARHIAENPDMEFWKKAINAISLDSFYQGSNRSKAKMNIGWFFKNRTVANLMDVHETKKDLFKGVLDD